MSDLPPRPKILIVDDSPSNIAVMQRALEEGRDILSTTQGQNALQIAKDEKPDLILLDIMMPEVDGYEVCKQLKADDTVRDIPIIFVTALSSEKDEYKGLALGAIDYISKPFDVTLLDVLVRNHLQLKHRQDKLQRLLRERAQLVTELEESNKAAEAANRAKNAFLATMSHEVRSPMNAVIGMTDLALKTDLTNEQRQYLELAFQSSQALMEVLNNILEFSRIDSGKLKLESVEFNPLDVVESLCTILAIPAHQRGLELVHEVDPTVPHRLCGDPLRLRQTLLNLVNNAIKFTKKGEVVVRLALKQGSDDDKSDAQGEVCLHFTVTDTGQGVPPDQHTLIFGRFIQGADYMTRTAGGTGLGLAISRKIVELMGGRIWVESKGNGQGSVFHFTARLKEAPETWEKHFFTRNGDFSGLRILLHESHDTARSVIARILAWCGAEVIQTKSCAETQQQLQKAYATLSSQEKIPFDLVLLECSTPDPDRMALSRWLQENILKTVPICIMLPTGQRRYDLPGCEELQVVQGLLKPLKRYDLLHAVNKALGRPIQKNAEAYDIEESLPPLSPSAGLALLDPGRTLTEKPPIKPTSSAIASTRLEFLENAIHVLDDLSSAMAIGQTDKVLPHLRWVKENATAIGAEPLKNAALRMLIAIRRGEISDASEQMSSLKREFQKVAEVVSETTK